jgi:hypothetical protein
MPEIAPPFAQHEIDCGTEAAHGIQGRNWFLQYEICSHPAGLLRGGTPIQDGKGDGIPVAGAFAQAFQYLDSAFQVIAVEMMASNFSVRRILPEPNRDRLPASIESFSRAGCRTRMISGPG